MVISDDRVMLSNGDFTVPLPTMKNSTTKPHRVAFVEAWNLIFDHFIWRQHDWMVQVDAQTLLFANELKMRLHNHAAEIKTIAAGKGVYIQTCAGEQRFTKALYVISQDGVGSMAFHRDKCRWEDIDDEVAWVTQCLEAVQAHPVPMSEIFVDTGCTDEGSLSLAQSVSQSDCSSLKVAFHPLSSSLLMDQCVSQAREMTFK